MALILSIDTANPVAAICLGRDNKILATELNRSQKDHASFVQPAIDRVVNEAGFSLSELDAVAVTAGPGSYTGLRVGLASAKGLCFSLNKPLILINTLTAMAQTCRMLSESGNKYYYLPLIDARRMEVFASLFDQNIHEIIATAAFDLTNLDLSSNDLLNQLTLQKFPIMVFGTGMQKFKSLNPNGDFHFSSIESQFELGLNNLAQQHFLRHDFADIAYSEPFYFKPFFTTAKIL